MKKCRNSCHGNCEEYCLKLVPVLADILMTVLELKKHFAHTFLAPARLNILLIAKPTWLM